MAKPELDLNAWPVAVFRWPERLVAGDLQAHLDDAVRLFARRERFAVVHDCRRAPVGDLRLRQALTNYMREHRADIVAYTAGVAFTFESGLLRAALAGVLWLVPLPCPSRVFATVGPAMTWARTCVVPQNTVTPAHTVAS